MFNSGKFGGVLEKPSFSKIKKYIQRYHPIDPNTNHHFKLNSRITVRNYSQKLMDIFGLFWIKKVFK